MRPPVQSNLYITTTLRVVVFNSWSLFGGGLKDRFDCSPKPTLTKASTFLRSQYYDTVNQFPSISTDKYSSVICETFK